MRILDAEQTRAALGYVAIADAVAEVLERRAAGKTTAPPRGVMELPEDATLLLMPATDGDIAVTKLVTVHPRNGSHGLPTIQGEMVILEAATGRRLALVDGGTVSARRTAAVSLLAARELAPRRDAPMLVIGAGTQARVHIEAFREGLGVSDVRIHSRTRSRAEELAEHARSLGMTARVVDDPAEGLDEVRLVVAATTSTEPVVPVGLADDTFVAAVGAYRSHMAELPGALLARSPVVVDTLEGAQEEAGDLIRAAGDGDFDWSRAMTLERVLQGERPRTGGVIVFKSVGQSLWDLAAGRVLAATVE
ncbi:MAG TPA: delta(1)-pyrroline-2-carboxylate reductase family protein [Gammaproteobacteria bacterium]|nr:delta(1)-pyrroline-2-carboxylate reductase family protein [Gammaproteobacteria bacterium]